MADRLASDPQLTPVQQTELADLFAGRQERLEGFHREVRVRFEQEECALRDAVREILTTEQGEVFDGPWQPGRRGFEDAPTERRSRSSLGTCEL